LDSTVKVLVVDDSAFMRKSISFMLGSSDEIEVIGTACDGEEGCSLAKKLSPDVITMDVEMPKMDGLSALRRIMKDSPTSVIMVSSLTTEGAEATVKALEYGAVDFIPKDHSYVNTGTVNFREELIGKVKEFGRQKSLMSRLMRIRRNGIQKYAAVEKQAQASKLPGNYFKAIAIGVSTGGPLSLQKVIPLIKSTINCPVFIVQHMPPKFTKSLADRLNDLSNLNVKEAENGEIIQKNTVYIAPGGFHLKTKKNTGGNLYLSITEEPKTTLHRPSVDVMIKSVVDIYGKNTLGIIMTGMGKDGLEGIKKLKNSGGYCIAQDEDTCVVYGMPKAIVDAGYADIITPLENIQEIINGAF